MKLLLVAATSFELAPCEKWLRLHFQEISNYHFKKDHLQVQLLITGVGLSMTSYAMGKVLSRTGAFDLAINAGIAGALNTGLEIGEVCQVRSEVFADLGIEEADGQFVSIHELELIPADQYPFSGGRLVNPASDHSFLRPVDGISVNKVHGFAPSIAALRQKYRADVESMEGAAFFYACLMEQISFLEIRAISNYVESRNKDKWNIPLAIDNLNQAIIEILKSLRSDQSLY